MEAIKAKKATKRELIVATMISQMIGTSVFSDRTGFSVTTGFAWETWLARPGLQWVRSAYAAAMILASAVFLPFAVPVLPVESYIRYSEWMHFQPPRIETHKLGPLPQLYADQFGWEEMVATVANVYNNLPPQVRVKTAIFGQNYG